MSCQRPEKERKLRHRAWVWAVCLDLTLCCRCVWMNLCGEPHQSTTEGLSCWDLWPWRAPKHREGGGGGAQDTLTHKGKGGPPNLQQLKKQARIKMVICLVNFYRDLRAPARVNHRRTYITHTEIVTLRTASHPLRHMLSLILLNQSSLLSVLHPGPDSVCRKCMWILSTWM